MENPGSLSNVGSLAYLGKQSLLPPRNPSRCISPPASEYIPGSSLESHDLFKSTESSVSHYRTSSDELLAEEQPAWLDDLLSEPGSPIRSKGHRRSASDTATYLNFGSTPFGEDNHLRSHFEGPFCLFQGIDRHDDVWRPNSYGKHRDKGWQVPNKNGNNLKKSASCSAVNKVGTSASKSSQKQVREAKEGAKPDNDSKRVKQQNAHRARLRRLQYISELERNVQVLQAEGSEMSTAIHYLDQQLIILSMENRALKQRLDSLAWTLWWVMQRSSFCWRGKSETFGSYAFSSNSSISSSKRNSGCCNRTSTTRITHPLAENSSPRLQPCLSNLMNLNSCVLNLVEIKIGRQISERPH